MSVSAIVLSMLLLQNDPPDYISQIDIFKHYAKMVTSAGSCRNMGYTVDANGIAARHDELIGDAIIAGIRGSDADSLMKSALDQQRDDMKRLVDLAGSHDGFGETYESARSVFVQRTQKFVDYWVQRCADLSSDANAGRYFVPLSDTSAREAGEALSAKLIATFNEGLKP